MIINFLGDSITEGCGASNYNNCYVELVKKELSIDVRNYGVSGTRIAKQKTPSSDPRFDLDFQLRADSMDESDFLFVFGGTNDFDHGDAPMGEINSADPYTFCGGLNNLIKILLSKYPKEKICFILPLHRSYEDKSSEVIKNKIYYPLNIYLLNMKTILNNNNIKYIDMFKYGPVYSSLHFVDIVHPNDLGHELIKDILVKYLKDNNII